MTMQQITLAQIKERDNIIVGSDGARNHQYPCSCDLAGLRIGEEYRLIFEGETVIEMQPLFPDYAREAAAKLEMRDEDVFDKAVEAQFTATEVAESAVSLVKPKFPVSPGLPVTLGCLKPLVREAGEADLALRKAAQKKEALPASALRELKIQSIRFAIDSGYMISGEARDEAAILKSADIFLNYLLGN